MKNQLSWFLIIILSISGSGCRTYFKVAGVKGPAVENINASLLENKKMILHLKDQAWVLKSVRMKDHFLTGTISETYLPPLQKRRNSNKPSHYNNSYKRSQGSVLNEVHIYVNDPVQLSDSRVSVPVSGIQKVETYAKDRKATRGSFLFGGFFLVGTAALLFLAYVVSSIGDWSLGY